VAVQPTGSAFIWSTDLKNGLLPAVCVKTGRSADASVKFRFITVPGWAYAFLLLALTGIGLLVPFIIMRVVSRTASGRLPYQSSDAFTIKTWRWLLVGTFLAIPVLLIVALASLTGDTTIATLLWVLLLVDVLGTLAIRYLVSPRLGPHGYVHKSSYPEGRWVELRRVYPAFAAAVADMYNSRWLAVQPQPPPPQSVPLPPPPA